MAAKEQQMRYRAYCEERGKRFKDWVDAGYPDLDGDDLLPMPTDLIGLRCGAKTRAGTPCKLLPVRRNGRCRFHGGLSTGPITDAGKRKVSQNAKKQSPWKASK